MPDNLRTGVERPDLHDPKINRSYAELAAHYDTLIDPLRVRRPKDKARVERPMPYVRDSFWRGREFTSLEAMQRAALVCYTEVAGQLEVDAMSLSVADSARSRAPQEEKFRSTSALRSGSVALMTGHAMTARPETRNSQSSCDRCRRALALPMLKREWALAMCTP